MESALRALAGGVPVTLLVTVAAFLIGTTLAVPLTAARRVRYGWVRVPADALVDLLRSVPPVVWLFLLFFGLPSVGTELSSLTAAIGGLGVIAAAYVSEIYRAGLESLPPGQDDAARALGLGTRDRLRFVTGPQALIVVVPALGAYTVGLLKDCAIVSAIGVNDITFRALTESQRTLEGLSVFGAAAIFYLALSVPFALIARWVTARLTVRMGLA